MKRIPLKSSNLEEVGYKPDTQELEVTFKGGKRYTYQGVSKAQYNGLLGARSAGSFFHQNIRSVCQHREGGCDD